MLRKSDRGRPCVQLPLLLTVLLGLSVLSACGSRAQNQETAGDPVSTVTVAPTEAPDPTEIPEPTAEPAPESPLSAPESPLPPPAAQSPVDSMEHTVDPMLVNIRWEWVMRAPNGNSFGDITVPDPENYTLLFNEDGTFSAQIDCNRAGGRYATGSVENAQRRIFMELDATTMAVCGDPSLDMDMADMFGPAQSYHFEDDGNTLIFSWAAAGPLDTYRNAAITE